MSNREKSNIALVILGKMDIKIISDSGRTNITSELIVLYNSVNLKSILEKSGLEPVLLLHSSFLLYSFF